MDSTAATTGPVASATVTSADGWFGKPLARTAIVAIAFLLALTTARNTDVWARLASGRAVASGSVTAASGLLPLSWLADLATFLIFTTFGGSALVIGKSIIVAAMAAILLGKHVSGRGILGVFLAILALDGWLPLSPVCLSYLLVALVVAVLNPPPGEEEPQGWRHEVRSHWPLLVCFAIWANADVWCMLGVAIVVLHAIGRSAVQAINGDPFDRGPWRRLVLVLAAVTLSPIPWHASTVLHEFSNQLANVDHGTSPLRADLFSVLRDRRFEGAASPVAFWLLIVVGSLSFGASLRSHSSDVRQQSWERFLPWISLLVAAALNVRFAPFFVVVSGATIARNFRPPAAYPQGVAKPIAVTSRMRRFQTIARHFVRVLGVAMLLAATWAGWLQPVPTERRNWTVEPDPSLVSAADEVGRWYATGILEPAQQTVFFAPEAEDVFAWFAPGVVTAQRSSGGESSAVARIRAAILGTDGDELSDPRIGCVVVCDPNRIPFVAALHRLSASPEKWKLASLRGRVAVFVRTDCGLAAIDLRSRAFGSTTSDRAPAAGTPLFASLPHWSDPFLVPRPARSLDRDEAVTYLLYEEATRDQRMVRGANRFLASQLAAIVAAPAHGPVEWATDQRMLLLTLAAGKVRPPSEEPPPIPFGRFASFLMLTEVTADHYLAVRAARRGVATSPRDPATYAALGEAYLHLLSDPLEVSWSEGFPALRRLRLIQAAAAFRQALVLEPTLAPARLGLANVYLQQQFLDLAAVEFQAYERYSRVQVSVVPELTRTVESSRKTTDANAANLSVLDRARLAARNGLSGLALDVLLQSDVAAFGAPGIALELDLLLAAGRVNDARDWLAPEHRNVIGALTYDWLRIQAAAATGDYAGAATVLRNQIDGTPSGTELLPAAKDLRAVATIIGTRILGNKQNLPQVGGTLLSAVFGGLSASGRQVAFEYQTRTEGHVLLALLALEQGDVSASARHLENVRGLWRDVDEASVLFPSPTRTMARQMESLIRRE